MNKKPLYLFCLCLLIELAILLFVLFPTIKSLRNDYDSLAASKEESSTLDTQLTYFKDLSKEESEIKEVGGKIIQYLPDKPETGSFMIALDALAKELNVEINSISFTTLAPQSKKSNEEEAEGENNSTQQTAQPATVNEYGFSIAPQGTYDNLLTFLSKLETFGRFNSIQSLSLTPSSDLYSITLSGKTYYKEVTDKTFTGQKFNIDRKTLSEIENSMSYGKPVDLKNETTPFGRTNPFLPY